MLVDFRFENFRSYRHEARLQLAHAGAIDRVVAIYGPNASGKTNVVHALAMMRSVVLKSSSITSNETLPHLPFLLLAKQDYPDSLFEATFTSGTKVYRYGFSLNSKEITAEWLFEYRHLAACFAGEEEMLFVREDGSVEGRLEDARRLLPKTNRNALLLAKLDQDNDAVAHQVLDWFQNLVLIAAYKDDELYSYSHNQVFRGPYHSRILDLVRFADPSVAEIREASADRALHLSVEQRRELNDRGLSLAQVMFLRRAADTRGKVVAMPFDEFESGGTQKMFCMAGPVSDILAKGYTLVMDEFDAKFHPALTRKLVSMFADTAVNEHGAQLIVTTHDVELMRSGLLSPRQIFFSEKNQLGESALYSLANFKGSDAYKAPGIADDYLRGIFGAVPSFDVEMFREEVAHE